MYTAECSSHSFWVQIPAPSNHMDDQECQGTMLSFLPSHAVSSNPWSTPPTPTTNGPTYLLNLLLVGHPWWKTLFLRLPGENSSAHHAALLLRCHWRVSLQQLLLRGLTWTAGCGWWEPPAPRAAGSGQSTGLLLCNRCYEPVALSRHPQTLSFSLELELEHGAYLVCFVFLLVFLITAIMPYHAHHPSNQSRLRLDFGSQTNILQRPGDI